MYCSIFSGSSTMVGMITALLLSTLVITTCKPSARSLALFNFIADILAVIVGLSFILIDCNNLPVCLL